ncbi:branched-chain amino acid transport system permease protein [uncultured Gammaproteobacteria bacterium]
MYSGVMFTQQLANGVVLGSTYALFALGFTLMFGVLRVLNLTYGFYFSAGALVALGLARMFGAPIWLVLPAGALAAGVLAVVLDWLLLTPLRRAKAPELTTLMVTLGAVLVLYSAMTVWLGTEIRRFPPGLISHEAVMIGDTRFGFSQLLIVVTTLVLVVALLVLMKSSRLGLSIRAVAENEDAARLMGVNVPLTVAMVSFLSGVMGGTAGVLIGLNFNAIQPFMGEHMMLRGFAVIIIGGLGDIRGALLAGLALGVAEVMIAGYVDSSLKEGLAFALMVLVLWIKPSGLFGQAVGKRA